MVGGYLWSPKRNANGARNPFYESMREVSPGDIVFSFVDSNGRFVASKSLDALSALCSACLRRLNFRFTEILPERKMEDRRDCTIMCRMNFVASVSGILAAVTLASSVSGQGLTLPPGVERVTSVEGITNYKLANGLHVLLFPDSSKPTITIDVTYAVGSRHENYGETGMAHLLEHMVGSATRNHRYIANEMSAHGARWNASATWDRTSYHETFQATDEKLNWALDLESDRMVNSILVKDALDVEMKVVRNEFEIGQNDAKIVLQSRAMAAAYLWHNYGNWPTGSRSDIENVPIERLQAFYRNFYQPDNCVLTIAGRIDEAKALQLVVKYFGKIPRPSRTLMNTYTVEPVQDGERMVTVRRTGDVQLLHAVYHMPDSAHPDTIALQILAVLMRRQPGGRLHKALVETKKATSAGSFLSPMLREPGVISFTATVPRQSSLDEARDALIKTVEDFVATPPSDEEVGAAKTELLKQTESDLNDSERIALGLRDYIAAGDWRLLFLRRDRLKRVTKEDVLRVAKLYLKSSNRTLAMFIPTDSLERSIIPPQSNVTELLKDYKGGQAVTPGEVFDPSPENIEKRIIRRTLVSGMKVVMLPKKTRGESVNAEIVLRMGDLQTLSNRTTAGGVAAGLLMRGTTRRNREQITDELTRLKTRLTLTGGSREVRASIETTRANLADAFKLAAEILHEPAFAEREFEQYKDQQLAEIQSTRSDPQVLAITARRQHMNPYPKGDPRYESSPDEKIEQLKNVKLADVRQFHREFYGASHGQFVIVGDFDSDAISRLASELFGTWRSPLPHQRIEPIHQPIAAVRQSFRTPDKANAFVTAGMMIDIGQTHRDFPAMVLGNYILGSGGPNSRLNRRIRVKEGLSYHPESLFLGSARQESGIFWVTAPCAPQNADKVVAAIKDEIVRVLRDGFTEEEVTQGKKGWLQWNFNRRSQDRELAVGLSWDAYEDRTMAYHSDLARKIEALTSVDIVQAMRRHMDPARLSFFVAGDFDKPSGSVNGRNWPANGGPFGPTEV